MHGKKDLYNSSVHKSLIGCRFDARNTDLAGVAISMQILHKGERSSWWTEIIGCTEPV